MKGKIRNNQKIQVLDLTKSSSFCSMKGKIRNNQKIQVLDFTKSSICVESEKCNAETPNDSVTVSAQQVHWVLTMFEVYS